MGHTHKLSSVYGLDRVLWVAPINSVPSMGSARSFGSHPELSPVLSDRPGLRRSLRSSAGRGRRLVATHRQRPRCSRRASTQHGSRRSQPPLSGSAALPSLSSAASCGEVREVAPPGPLRPLSPVPGGSAARRGGALAWAEAALQARAARSRDGLGGLPPERRAGTARLP